MQAGALVAGVVFALTSDQGKFYISAACGLAGVLCTFLFIPDITGLDLREGDRRWLKSLEKGLQLAPCNICLLPLLLLLKRNVCKTAMLEGSLCLPHHKLACPCSK